MLIENLTIIYDTACANTSIAAYKQYKNVKCVLFSMINTKIHV